MANHVKCPSCAKEFPKQSKMELHFKKIHKCKWCQTQVDSKEDMKTHLASCESRSLFLYRCEHCGKVDAHKGHHERHTISCQAKNTKAFKCSLCEKAFTNAKSMKTHEQRHCKEKNIHCKLCPKKFSSKKDLLDHSVCHKKVECNYCHENIIEKTLEKHIKDNHHIENAGVSMYVKEKNKKVSFNCHLCPKIFNHRGLFKRHLNSKHKTTEDSINMPTVSCEECPLKFLNNLSLEQHQGKVHNSTKT